MLRAPTNLDPYDPGWLSVQGAVAGAAVVRSYQCRLTTLGGQEKKADGTWVTAADRRSQAAIVEELLPFGLPILGEESKKLAGAGAGSTLAQALAGWQPTGPADEGNLWLVDPLDGTRLARQGNPGSTVLVLMYSRRRKQIVASATVYPATGVTIFTYQGKTYAVTFDTGTWQLHPDSRLVECHVSQASLGKDGVVLIEHSWPFTRDDHPTGGPKRQVLNETGMQHLILSLVRMRCFDVCGSNGANAAVVATGGAAVWGNTATGGPWDLNGLLAVQNAGGAIRSIRIRDDGRGIEVAKNPLDVMWPDMVIGANTEQNANLIVGVYADAVGAMFRG